MSQTGQEQWEAELSARLGNGIKRVEQVLMAEKGRALRDFGLTVPQYATLIALHYVPSQSAAGLARTALVSPQTMATILGNLEAKDLIARGTSPLHAKVQVCDLTPAGDELVTSADRAVRAIEEDLARAFTPDEFQAFKDFLTRAESHILGHS